MQSTLTQPTTTLRFHEWLHLEAEKLRFKQTSCFIFLADEIEKLAVEARMLDCDGPDEFCDRREALERLNSLEMRRGEN